MSKAIWLTAGFVLGLAVGTAVLVSRAQSELPEETISAAADAGADPTEVQGALNTLADAGMPTDPRSYLVSVGMLPAPIAPRAPMLASGHQVRVRLTYYVESGVTYGGGRPYLGSTACSWNFALGTRFRLPDGQVFTCNDRGLLGSSGWLDLWRRADLAARYGPSAVVTVLP